MRRFHRDKDRRAAPTDGTRGDFDELGTRFDWTIESRNVR